MPTWKQKTIQNYGLAILSVALLCLVSLATTLLVRAALTPWKPSPVQNISSWSQITSGGDFSCGISSGQVYCWGTSDAGRLGFSTTTNTGIRALPQKVIGGLVGRTVTSVDSGAYHSCALTNEAVNNLYCWGYNNTGQIGVNSTTDQLVPVNVAGALAGKTVTSISAGHASTCALTNEATNNIYCWGMGNNGRIGDGNIAAHNILTPYQVTGGSISGNKQIKIDIGGGHVCVLNSTGYVNCWGWNGYGQVGDNTTIDKGTPVQATGRGSLTVGMTVRDIATGFQHTCVIANDTNGPAYRYVHCWGDNQWKQLGNGTTVNSPEATRSLVWSADQIVAGYSSTCELQNGSPFCWGWNGVGITGNNSVPSGLADPTSIYVNGALSGKTISSLQPISSTGYTPCVITGDNKGFCWGFNMSGQAGNGQLGPNPGASVPTLINPPVSGLSEGGNSVHQCAITAGKVYCWGSMIMGN